MTTKRIFYTQKQKYLLKTVFPLNVKDAILMNLVELIFDKTANF
jgi:hypothetical protein